MAADPKQQYLNHGVIYAAETNNLELLKTFICFGGDPSTTSVYIQWKDMSATPLALATMNKNTAMFEFLLEHGADLDGRRFTEWILDEATVKLVKDNPHIIHLLLRKGVEIRFRSKEWLQFLENVLLVLRIGKEIDNLEPLKSLLDLGTPKFDFDDDIEGENDKPIVSIPIECDSVSCLELLLERGAPLKYKRGRYSEFDPVLTALNSCSPDVLRYLLDLGIGCKEGHELHVACLLEDVSLAEKLIRDGADVNSEFGDVHSPLFIASKLKNNDLVKLLMQSRAEPWSMRPLSSPLEEVVRGGDAELLETLIREYPRKIDLNAVPKYGDYDSLLTVAIEAGNLETFNLLLKYGADATSALADLAYLACKVGSYSILKSLIEQVVDVKNIRQKAEKRKRKLAKIACCVGYRYYNVRKSFNYFFLKGNISPFGDSLALCPDPESVRLLLDLGAELEEPSLHPWGPLSFYYRAMHYGKIESLNVYWEKCGHIITDYTFIFDIYFCSLRQGWNFENCVDVIKCILSNNVNWANNCFQLNLRPRDVKGIDALLELGCTFDVDLFSAACYNKQVYLFTKLVQENCGRNHNVDDFDLLLLMFQKNDQSMVQLLHDCGHSIRETQLRRLRENYIMHRLLHAVPAICNQPRRLQDLCRIEIRGTLFRTKTEFCHINTLIGKLPLPKEIQEFLSFTGQHALGYLCYCE
jgi:ankyrin repeat protein